MLTVVAEQRGTPFGTLQQSEDGSITVLLNSLGKEVQRCLTEMQTHAPGLELLNTVVMPDHIHAVVFVHQRLKHHLGQVVRGFKYATTKAYLQLLDARFGGTHRIADGRPSAAERHPTALQPMPPETPPTTAASTTAANSMAASTTAASSTADIPPSTGHPTAIIPASAPRPVGSGKSAATTAPDQAHAITFVKPLWSSGYHDRILTGRGQLNRMLRYVSDNPRRGWIKQQHRDLFYNKQTLHIPLTLEQARWLLREARALGVMHELRGVLRVLQLTTSPSPVGDGVTAAKASLTPAWQEIPWWEKDYHTRATTDLRAFLCLSAMGNLFLKDEALLLPIRLSRQTSAAELARQTARTLQRCALEGAVIVTPAVSRPEQELMNAVLAGGHAAIKLLAEGMGELWAPPGPLLEVMGQGRLLYLAPWPQRQQSMPRGKGQFELLNVLCRLLADMG